MARMANGGVVSVDPVIHDGLVVQSQSENVRRQRMDDLVGAGLIARPYESSSDEEVEAVMMNSAKIERQMQEFIRKEVNPEMGLRVAKGRKLLAESGILDDLLQMRQAQKERPATAIRRTSHKERPATAVGLNDKEYDKSIFRQLLDTKTGLAMTMLSTGHQVPSHIVRQRMSPLFNQTWQDTNAREHRCTTRTIQSLTRPLPHRIPSRPATALHRGRKNSFDTPSDDSIYWDGHAFAGRGPDIRPASAAQGRLKLDFDALRKFNEANARGEIPDDITSDDYTNYLEQVEEASTPSNFQTPSSEEIYDLSRIDMHKSSSPTQMNGGLTSLDMLTAPEFEHIPIDQLMPTMFGLDVVQRPHRGLLELASKKLVEGNHAKVLYFP